MAETFDPYRKWLGIPPSQQPPHHYRLLGVELFEEDVEVIDTAASQRMSYLQELGGGSYVKESQRLLNEVSAARRVLLDAKKKKEYDAELKSKLAASAPAAPPPVAPPPVAGGHRVKRAQALDDDDDSTITINLNEELTMLRQKSAATSKSSSGSKHAPAKGSGGKSKGDKAAAEGVAEHRPRSRKKKSPLPMLIVLCLLVGAAGGGVFYVLQDRKPGDMAAKEGAEPAYAAADLEPIAVAPKRTVATTPALPKSQKPPPATSSRGTSNERNEPAEPATNFFPPAVSSPPSASASATGKPPASAAATPSATGPAKEVAAAVTPQGLPKESAPPPSVLFGLDTVAAPDVRPHYTPPGRTMRDLRGFFREGNDYHLFYDGTETVSRKVTEVWGHAVSRDLFSWKEQDALEPPVPGEQSPQLGSVVVDRENASGLGKSDAPPWIAAFTYAASGDAKKGIDVGLMFSTDDGKTWTAHEKNPVLKEQPATSRWPRLFYHAGSKQWGLLTYVSTDPPPAAATATDSKSKKAAPPPPTEPPKTTYRLFTSSDLVDWKQQHEIPYPAGAAPAELVEIAGGADASKSRWMFLQGRGRYWMGEFDGTRFTTDRRGGSLQVGPGFYGFRALDGGDRKEVVIMSLVASSDSGAQVAAAAALPRRLTLQGEAFSPIREPTPAAWNGAVKQWANHDLQPILPLAVFDGGSVFRLQLSVQAEQASALVVTIFGQPVTFDFVAKQYQVAGRSPGAYASTVVQIEGIVDVDLAELMIGGVGSVGFRTASGPDARTPLEVRAVGGKARITSLVVTPLKVSKPAAAAAPKP